MSVSNVTEVFQSMDYARALQPYPDYLEYDRFSLWLWALESRVSLLISASWWWNSHSLQFAVLMMIKLSWFVCTVFSGSEVREMHNPTTQPVSQDKHKKPAQQSPNQTSPTCFCSYSVNWQPHHWEKLQINLCKLSQVTQLKQFWCLQISWWYRDQTQPRNAGDQVCGGGGRSCG